MKSLALFVSLCVGICVHSASIRDGADLTTEVITIGPITGATDTAPTLGPASQPTISAATFPPASAVTETAPTIQPITSTASQPSGTTEHSMPSQETTEPYTGTTVTPGTSPTGTSPSMTTGSMTTGTKSTPSPRTKTSKAPTTRTTAKPESKSFDGGSFGGGIALGFGLAVIMIVVYRCYVMRTNAKSKGYSGVE